MKKDDVVGIELKFARYGYGLERDIHFVKEYLHKKDGTYEKRFRYIEDYKRPFWITKKQYRNHKQHKESEDIKKVVLNRSRQKDLADNIGRALGRPGYRNGSLHRLLNNSPYIYGADIDSETFLKYEYKRRFDKFTEFEVAVLDIEADTETDEVFLNGVCMKGRLYVAVNKKIVDKIDNAVDKLYAHAKKSLPKIDLLKDMDVVIEIFENEADVITKPIEKLHEWSPDILAIWGMAYDLPALDKRMRLYDLDPKDVWSDPTVPKDLRIYDFRKGALSTVTEGNVNKNFAPHQVRDIVRISASFYIMDAMQTYYVIRSTAPKEPGGYGLDNIMKRYTKLGKLKIDLPDTKYLFGKFWHDRMVKKHPIEYGSYHQWDLAGFLHLEYTIKDLPLTMPILAGITTFDKFHSGPTRLVGAFTEYLLSIGRVPGVRNEDQKGIELLGRRGWVVTLEAFRRLNKSTDVTNHKLLENLIALLVLDDDMVSSYPSNTVASNLGKDTVRKELSHIENRDPDVTKQMNMNLMFGDANVIEYSHKMFKQPTPLQLRYKYKKEEDIAA